MTMGTRDGCNGKHRQALACAGVWGGIQTVDAEILAGPAIASIYSSPCQGGKGGDIHYLGVCRAGKLVRLAVADVAGHGRAITDVSQIIYDSLEAHMCECSPSGDPVGADHEAHPCALESGRILSEVNRSAFDRGLTAMTTAVVVAYSPAEQTLSVAYAGHPPVLLRPADQAKWSFLEPDIEEKSGTCSGHAYPLALAEDSVYGETRVHASHGDRLFVYTDGVTETPDVDRELFGEDRLRVLLQTAADAPLPEIKSAVLRALFEHSGGPLTHDDVTLVAMEIR